MNWINEELPHELVELQEEEEVDFVIPPQDEIERLHQLARLGNMQKIGEWADYLKGLDARYAPFAKQLKKLAESYQSKAIVALVERYRGGHEEVRTENPSVKE